MSTPGERYVQTRRRSLFDLEHHLRYLAEVFAGDAAAVHTRLVERSAKTLHTFYFLVNETTQTVCNWMEAVSVTSTSTRDGPSRSMLSTSSSWTRRWQLIERCRGRLPWAGAWEPGTKVISTRR